MERWLKLVFGISIVILFIIFSPIIFMWSITTLFGIPIPLTFSTWFSSFFIMSILVTRLK